MSDGIHTEILSGVSKGLEITTDAKAANGNDDEQAENNSESSPFAPKGPRQKKK